MGFGDKLKDLRKQAQEAVSEHSEQVHNALDAATVAANAKTRGKHAQRIAKFGEKASGALDKFADGSEGASEAPATDAAAPDAAAPDAAAPDAAAPEPGQAPEPTVPAGEPEAPTGPPSAAPPTAPPSATPPPQSAPPAPNPDLAAWAAGDDSAAGE
jgi:hypothetical protein